MKLINSIQLLDAKTNMSRLRIICFCIF